jgi:type I restriction enzyme, S subunit
VKTAELGDFCDFVQGGRQKLSGKHFVDKGYPAFGAGGMNGYLPTAEFERDGIILSAIGARCGKCFLAEGKWSSLANTQIIFPDDRKADIRFLWYQLNDEHRWPRRGLAQPFIRPSDVRSHRVFFPPLDEQRRIAAILEKADALRRKRKRSLELLQGHTRSIFMKMFGSLTENDRQLPTVGISDTCQLIVDCVNRTAPTVENPTAYKMIRTTNVRRGSVDLHSVRFVTKDTFDRWNRRATPRIGDVLLTREAPVGEAGILLSNDRVFLGQRLMLYRVDEAVATPEFLCHSFQDDFLKRQFDQMGSGSTVKHLPLPACRAFQLRLPPLSEQQDFSARVRSTWKLLATLETQAAELNGLFASLQSRAFAGLL